MRHHIDMITHGMDFDNSDGGTGRTNLLKLVELHLSETNESCQAQTWTTCCTNSDANQYAIYLPQNDKCIAIAIIAQVKE